MRFDPVVWRALGEMATTEDRTRPDFVRKLVKDAARVRGLIPEAQLTNHDGRNSK